MKTKTVHYLDPMSAAVRRTAAFCLFFAFGAFGLTVSTQYGHFTDNFQYLRPSYGLAVSQISLGGPVEAEVHGKRTLSIFRNPPSGLIGFDTAFTSVGLGLSANLPYLDIDIHGNIADVVLMKHFEGSGSLSARIPLLNRFRLMPGWESSAHVANNSAFAEVMSIRAHSHSAELGLGMKMWEAWASYGIEYLDKVDSTTYGRYMEGPELYWNFGNKRIDPVLEAILDSADIKVNPIPDNRIEKLNIYFFGPAFPFLYVGGYYTLTKAKSVYIIPTAQYTMPDTTLYLPTADFPYKSREHEWAIGISLSLLGTFTAPFSPLSSLECKLDAPIVSGGRYKGYYYAKTRNTLELNLDSFSYGYGGLGPLKAEAKAHKDLPSGFRLSGSYNVYAEPYTAENTLFERYFGPDVYRYHEFSVTLSWTPAFRPDGPGNR